MPQVWLALVVALLAALALTPMVAAGLRAAGAVKVPRGRDVHTVPVPHVGGLALLGAFLLALGAAGVPWHDVEGILAGGLFVAAVGLVDDLWELPARAKLLGQVVSGVILVLFGVRILWVTNPFGGMFDIGAWGIPLTVVWVVSVENVINLIDGVDGLAAGITGIAALTMLVVALHQHEQLPAVLLASLLGAVAGFLRYNFNPARIFMGDTGAMFLGYMLAATAVLGTLKDTTTLALGVPMLVLGLPIFDTAFSIVRRVLEGRPIGSPDRGHLHHRLLDVGLTQRQTVLLLYLVTLVLGLAAIALTSASVAVGLVLVGAVAATSWYGARRVGLFRSETAGRRVAR